jgi:hypothetical protein
VILSAYAEDHGLCPWMNADSVGKKSLSLGLMLRRDSATGGYLAEALVRIGQSNLALMGGGGYFIEVPRALPVGLHEAKQSMN